MNEFTIASAHVRHEQTPIDEPIKVSFGAMTSRHAVFLVVKDDAGRRGVGESWVNFPLWAPWERVAAFEQAIIPSMAGREVTDIPQFIGELYLAFAGPAVQSGTLGSLLGALCAVSLLSGTCRRRPPACHWRRTCGAGILPQCAYMPVASTVLFPAI